MLSKVRALRSLGLLCIILINHSHIRFCKCTPRVHPFNLRGGLWCFSESKCFFALRHSGILYFCLRQEVETLFLVYEIQFFSAFRIFFSANVGDRNVLVITFDDRNPPPTPIARHLQVKWTFPKSK